MQSNLNELAPGANSGAPADRIVIDGLCVNTFIGVLDSEKGRRQQVRFDIAIETVSNYANIVRETGRYVSYADTVAYICDRADSEEHVELVETWAEDIAAFVLQNELVTSVTVGVRKTEIFPQAAGVGIVITRFAAAARRPDGVAL